MYYSDSPFFSEQNREPEASIDALNAILKEIYSLKDDDLNPSTGFGLFNALPFEFPFQKKVEFSDALSVKKELKESFLESLDLPFIVNYYNLLKSFHNAQEMLELELESEEYKRMFLKLDGLLESLQLDQVEKEVIAYSSIHDSWASVDKVFYKRLRYSFTKTFFSNLLDVWVEKIYPTLSIRDAIVNSMLFEFGINDKWVASNKLDKLGKQTLTRRSFLMNEEKKVNSAFSKYFGYLLVRGNYGKRQSYLQPMSEKEYARFQNALKDFIRSGSIPKEISLDFSVGKEYIRHSFYLFHKELWGTKSINSFLIKFAISVFPRIKSRNELSFKAHWSESPPLFFEDTNISEKK